MLGEGEWTVGPWEGHVFGGDHGVLLRSHVPACRHDSPPSQIKQHVSRDKDARELRLSRPLCVCVCSLPLPGHLPQADPSLVSLGPVSVAAGASSPRPSPLCPLSALADAPHRAGLRNKPLVHGPVLASSISGSSHGWDVSPEFSPVLPWLRSLWT